jgi:outer membrane lipoprotein LolB
VRLAAVARRTFVLVAVGILAGCAVPPPVPPSVAVPQSADAPQALSRVGRFALRVDEVGGRQNAVQGGFAWRDEGRHLSLDLTSPLGATLARVEVNPTGAMLRESNGKETLAADPDALIALVLGNRIPVSGLRDWLRGEMPPQPEAHVTQRDAQQRPLEFEQAGWRVKAQQYDTLGPTRLQMARTEADGQQVDLRLVISAP